MDDMGSEGSQGIHLQEMDEHGYQMDDQQIAYDEHANMEGMCAADHDDL
jgi:hypothetical protein